MQCYMSANINIKTSNYSLRGNQNLNFLNQNQTVAREHFSTGEFRATINYQLKSEMLQL